MTHGNFWDPGNPKVRFSCSPDFPQTHVVSPTSPGPARSARLLPLFRRMEPHQHIAVGLGSGEALLDRVTGAQSGGSKYCSTSEGSKEVKVPQKNPRNDSSNWFLVGQEGPLSTSEGTWTVRETTAASEGPCLALQGFVKAAQAAQALGQSTCLREKAQAPTKYSPSLLK